MNDPKRYTPDYTFTGTAFVPTTREFSEGEYVRYEDYARLKAEVERLTAIVGADAIDREHGMCCDASAQVERVGAENAHLHKGIYSLSLNVAQLKDEVERLTKAGDAFVLLLEDEGYDMESIREVDGWNAAKEGKPRA